MSFAMGGIAPLRANHDQDIFKFPPAGPPQRCFEPTKSRPTYGAKDSSSGHSFMTRFRATNQGGLTGRRGGVDRFADRLQYAASRGDGRSAPESVRTQGGRLTELTRFSRFVP